MGSRVRVYGYLISVWARRGGLALTFLYYIIEGTFCMMDCLGSYVRSGLQIAILTLCIASPHAHRSDRETIFRKFLVIPTLLI